MLSSALSMPASGNVRHDKSHPTSTLRSKSQPPIDNRHGYLLSPSLPAVHPMKNFFENLLLLNPHRYISTSTIVGNRTKVSSSLSTNIPSDRSSRIKIAQPSIISSCSLHSTNDQLPSEIRPLPSKLTLKFRRAGKLVLFAIYWCNLARKNNQLRSLVYQSYLQTTGPTEKYMFDKSNFKIQSYEILPVVEAFFKQPTGERDVHNTDQVRKCLADIKPFVRLPKGLQDQLLQQAWYECYSERRTIVRQGERAACFYIILSGSAIPTYKRATDGNVETLNVLTRGCTFGEKGLMTNSKQNFTVMSKTKLELLVIWKDDFKSIFMTNDRHCSKDDLRFLKNQVPCLHGFPIERLNEIPNAIQHCNFAQSEVIARDSRRMKHIFVVKKGSLAIWKRLEPNDHNRELIKNASDRIETEKIYDHEDEATGDNRTLFSEIQLSGDIDESASNANTLDADFRLSRLRRSPLDDQRVSSATSRSVVNDNKKFPGLVDKRDRLQLIDYDSISINPNNTAKLPSKRNRSVIKAPPKPKLIHPDKMIYIHIKTLNKGQHFGLADMLFPNQPALTLVSNECECLLLNKSSFIHLASDQYKQTIRRSEIPFPSDTVFYKTYHTNEVWKRFTKQVYIDAFERIHQQHPEIINRSTTINEQKHPILIGAA